MFASLESVPGALCPIPWAAPLIYGAIVEIGPGSGQVLGVPSAAAVPVPPPDASL